MFRKALFSVAIALFVAVSTATAADADPSWFGTLSCSCQPVPGSGPTLTDQINAGLRDGLAELPNVPDRVD